MIKRYSREAMEAIWSDQNRYQKWLDVEIAACEAMAEKKMIPDSAIKNIKSNARFDVQTIEEIEKTTKHDVISFLTCVAQSVGEDSRFIHMGLTSSDILDTSFALLLREAGGIIRNDIMRLLALLRARAGEHKNTLMIGRSHGIHAEPITFGLKLALWYQEMQRNLTRLERGIENISYGKISGAVGTYSLVTPEIEEITCKKLGLLPDPISSQIIQRDRHAEFFCTLAIIASSLDKFAQEIRLLQRTEVREVEEFFSPGQKGSSAMPHKRNPILSENISGLARLLRGYSLMALENIPLWHERDISHSAAERVIAPDATIALDFMLNRFCNIMEKLVVFPERMRQNLEMTHGIIFSQMVLLKLVEKGVSRENAYAVVQKHAMQSWEKSVAFSLLLQQDVVVSSLLRSEEIEKIFDYHNFLQHVDHTFRRVFGE
ncbi:MAG: adenylosuccinate lyase [Deltaproteobacteria bacterium]|nr:adenylosuccinate lyase [Deltaproteobacteria bacterium]